MEKTVSGNLLPFLKMYISYQESFFFSTQLNILFMEDMIGRLQPDYY